METRGTYCSGNWKLKTTNPEEEGERYKFIYFLD
jgi:hypothetical protein